MTTAAQIAAALGGARREGRAWRCRYPLHRSRSLTVRESSHRTVLITCWAGCERLDALAELRRCGLLAHARLIAACAPRRRGVDSMPNATTTPVASRERVRFGIPPSFRGEPGSVPSCQQRHHHADTGDAAMVAALLAPRGTARTACDGRGCRACRARHRQFEPGPVGGGAVRLGVLRRGGRLASGEGFETTLAVMIAPTMPEWAALSANGFRSLPEGTHGVICADNDANSVALGACPSIEGILLAKDERVGFHRAA
jgi:putative DNA primase/helicase